MNTPKIPIREDISTRAWVVAIFMAMLAVAVIVKMVAVQHFEKYKGKPWITYLSKTIHEDTIPPMRGSIYASDGSILATSLPYYEISLDPTVADTNYFTHQKLDTLCRGLVDSLKGKSFNYEEYYKPISFARYEYLQQQKYEALKEEDPERAKALQRKFKINRNIKLAKTLLSIQEFLKISQLPFFKKLPSGKTRGGVSKVIWKRYKPFGNGGLAGRTIGNLNFSGQKIVGIEAKLDSILAGRPGIGVYEYLDGNTPMPVNDGARVPPEAGADVYSTLNMTMQDIAETALRKALKKYDADYGCAIILETPTGAVRAMSNLSKISDSTYRDVQNYAVTGLTNPGSTFKLPTMMAALERGLPLDRMYATGDGQMVYKGFMIKDTKRGGHGTISARQVFEKSSNVGIHLIMNDYFYGKPNDYCSILKRFRLTEKTGIYMEGEASPLIRTPTDPKWSKVSLTAMSYGYESMMTPLQMAAFYNAVANGGYWVKPMLIKQIKKDGDIIADFPVMRDNKRFCSAATLAKARLILEGVVEYGTAKNIKSEQFKIAGKTGTAQKYVPGRGYVSGLFNVSFIGYFPANKPRYTCLVMVDSPKGGSMEQLYAGSVAAPVFREIADRIVGYDLGMHPPIKENQNVLSKTSKHLNTGNSNDVAQISKELNLDHEPTVAGWVPTKTKGNKVKWINSNDDPNKLPNLKGMTLRDAVYIIENYGYKVQYQGFGKVADYEQQANVFKLVLK